MKMPSIEEMRVEFHRLKAEFDAGMAQIKPLREAYEAKHAEISALEQTQLKPLADQLKTVREALGLHAIQKQMGVINRAINGETGAPPSSETETVTIAADDVGKLPPVKP